MPELLFKELRLTDAPHSVQHGLDQGTFAKDDDEGMIQMRISMHRLSVNPVINATIGPFQNQNLYKHKLSIHFHLHDKLNFYMGSNSNWPFICVL